jgi:hypothetical protein
MLVSVGFEILYNNSALIFFLANSPVMVAIHASALTNRSLSFCRVSICSRAIYYYEAIRINASKSGPYLFSSNSSIDTYGLIFKNHFKAASLNENFLMQNDDGPSGNQFQIIISLETTVNYILVVTTYTTNVKGNFSVTGRGVGSISFIDG